MGIIDRIILSIYTLLLTVLSAGVILMALSLISLETIQTSLNSMYGHSEAALVGALFLLVSLRLLMAGLRTSKGKDSIVLRNEAGNVYIAIDAVKNMVEKTARHIKGVRWTKVRVVNNNEGLKVKIRAVISPESNVPSVSDDIQQRVRERVRSTMGVELADVQVTVEDISNDFKGKQRVE